ncbi:Fe-Mn family superoxide dismutase [Nocardioides luteus]|uniref:Uncharacterized protein n=1 Tax=Nocardioides luteus TaxID=1844 RepID=A0ABQ5T1C4_9ACTN|nr:superoxide dismutase [Nocardioides luteus]MDR7311621.1 Fe-Mn family superoxide dismutase [Nocardioides luteus]GGR54364.1 hypothetical protein GCM10010197_21020 [Nocardioides luteus]GLJ70270.1 hypothetical protein GCM10017579_43060 [Nocardioides luteus]
MTGESQDPRLEMVDAAQRAAGVLAARARGDFEDASSLMASFEDSMTLAGGSMLLAELALGLYERESGISRDACLAELTVRLEASVRAG